MAFDLEINKKGERAVLVGLVFGSQTEKQLNEYLDELAFLAETAGAKTIKKFIQKLPHPEPGTFIGTGKLEEIRKYVEENEIDLVIFDDDLTGRQVNNLEEIIKRKILDRSNLILDIFANRAKTAQARAQVELAQLQYLLPRLKGLWTHLERQQGGIGMRGPGEKQIETDRQIVKDQIQLLKRELEKIDRQSQTQRKSRGELIRVSLVGYTNAGKSTLMNVLSKSDVFAENKLFATLDTTTRKVVFQNMPFLLSDTVGFIRKLPHHLIESFKSTLDEVREADLLIHVVDIAHPQFEDQIKTVTQTLEELKCAEKPTLLVFNKMDLYEQITYDNLLPDEIKNDIQKELKESWMGKTNNDVIFISASKRENIEELRDKIFLAVKQLYTARYPYKANFY